MNRLWVRLTLAFLLVAWLSVGAMALVVQYTTETSFQQYVAMRNGMGRQMGGMGAQMGATILDAAEADFLNHATRSLTTAAIVISLLAVVLGVGLAQLLTRPLKRLTQTLLDLPGGTLGQQVQVRGTRELHALTEAFNRTSQQLAEAELLRRRMAADIAHELRTPVSILRGHLEAMRDGVFALDQQHLAVVYDQTLHLGKLVDDVRLLTLAEARHLPLTLSPIAPTEIVHDLVEGFRPLALDAEVVLTVEQPAVVPSVTVDKLRIQQVLGNLLTNALRHTPAGGTIIFALSCQDERVRFTVSNTGTALNAEDARRVFEPFWRASESRDRDAGGSGLGLAIAKQLVELHAGKLRVETSPERTSFIVELPCSQPLGSHAPTVLVTR